jgi:hypothetical protein
MRAHAEAETGLIPWIAPHPFLLHHTHLHVKAITGENIVTTRMQGSAHDMAGDGEIPRAEGPASAMAFLKIFELTHSTLRAAPPPSGTAREAIALLCRDLQQHCKAALAARCSVFIL